MACEINSGDELASTELIFGGVLTPLTPEEAVAVLSALVFQVRHNMPLTMSQAAQMCRALKTLLWCVHCLVWVVGAAVATGILIATRLDSTVNPSALGCFHLHLPVTSNCVNLWPKIYLCYSCGTVCTCELCMGFISIAILMHAAQQKVSDV